jgi:penicillin-binding protein 2
LVDNALKLHRFIPDSIAKPLYDRGLLMNIRLSPFKNLTGLVGFTEGVIDENTTVSCRHGLAMHVAVLWDVHCHGGA